MSSVNSEAWPAAQKMADWRITKFGRHPDGYMHARVTPAGGKTIYVNDRFGSWMAPGTQNGRAVFKEVVNKDVLIELQRKRRALIRAEKGGDDDDGGPENGGSSGGADPESGVRGETRG